MGKTVCPRRKGKGRKIWILFTVIKKLSAKEGEEREEKESKLL